MSHGIWQIQPLLSQPMSPSIWSQIVNVFESVKDPKQIQIGIDFLEDYLGIQSTLNELSTSPFGLWRLVKLELQNPEKYLHDNHAPQDIHDFPQEFIQWVKGNETVSVWHDPNLLRNCYLYISPNGRFRDTTLGPVNVLSTGNNYYDLDLEFEWNGYPTLLYSEEHEKQEVFSGTYYMYQDKDPDCDTIFLSGIDEFDFHESDVPKNVQTSGECFLLKNCWCWTDEIYDYIQWSPSLIKRFVMFVHDGTYIIGTSYMEYLPVYPLSDS